MNKAALSISVYEDGDFSVQRSVDGAQLDVKHDREEHVMRFDCEDLKIEKHFPYKLVIDEVFLYKTQRYNFTLDEPAMVDPNSTAFEVLKLFVSK